MILAEAESQGTIDAQSHPIAGGAEVLGDWRNEPYAYPTVSTGQVAGWTAAGHDALNQVEFRLQMRLYRLQAQVLRLLLRTTHRHGLDQPQRKTVLDTIGQHAVDVMIIDSLHDDHVDLDWAKTQISCAFQSVENAVKNIPAGDLLVRVAIQCIETDIEALHASSLKCGRLFFKLCAIGAE